MIDSIYEKLGLGARWRLRGIVATASIGAGAQQDRTWCSTGESADNRLHASPCVGADPAREQPAVMAPARDECVNETSEVSRSLRSWPEIREAVGECVRCRLCDQRTQAVFGVGDEGADWLFVGEGPGAEEDLRGEPFVGQAGKLLDAMLAGLGIARGNSVYIANAVKCRPPNNRTPEPDEIEACFPYLQRQIELIQPRVIVALGRPAAQALLKQEVRIGAARGNVFRFGEIPVVVTYHPAYLLRNPADKGKAWADLCFARKTLEASPPKACAAV